MAWHRVQLTAAELEVVNAERESHPQSHVRRKMLVLWLLHCGLTRAKTATVACGLLPESWSSEYGSRRDKTQGGSRWESDERGSRSSACCGKPTVTWARG